jgi:hypothetical protein
MREELPFRRHRESSHFNISDRLRIALCAEKGGTFRLSIKIRPAPFPAAEKRDVPPETPAPPT